ncbi:cytochrome P450 [Mycena floridula]|nr:cytochrome P450 [Mycena floridula]
MTILLYKLIGVALGLAWILKKLLNIGKREKGLPPGPPTLPVLGNLHIFPHEFAYYKSVSLQLTEWAREYGEIYSLKLGPGTAIVISSASVVKELMDKRSASTADRPANYLGHAVNGGRNIVLARYVGIWRTLRKVAHTILTPQASDRHLPIQKAEVTQLMFDILQSPEDFTRISAAILIPSPRYETKEATEFFEMTKIWGQLLEPGAHPPADLLPFLNYIPERWAPWKQACKKVRSVQQTIYFGLLDQCENRLRNGERNGSYMEEVLEKQDSLGIDRELVGLVLSLVAFPEAQQKAKEEIDRVIGAERLPSLDDFQNLPYLQAIIKETHRFRPVLPLTVPHATSTVEEYNGYVIPQETIIFVNIWAILHDPDAFDEPDVFNPDRYLLTEHGTKVGFDASDFRANFAFGSGRRICPGVHLANNSLMLNVMNLLWAFDFNIAKDPSTKAPIRVDVFNYEPGITTTPCPFECSITPRSKAKAALIEREFFVAIPTFSKFEDGLSIADKEWLDKTRTISSSGTNYSL